MFSTSNSLSLWLFERVNFKIIYFSLKIFQLQTGDNLVFPENILRCNTLSNLILNTMLTVYPLLFCIIMVPQAFRPLLGQLCTPNLVRALQKTLPSFLEPEPF
jgi:hypothetical protein